jgi:DNA polymerase
VSDLTAAERRAKLVELYHEVRACHACPLGATRTNAVFGMGNADADLMFVGEAPGAEEDRQGLPFVGRAGKLLDELLGEIGMTRQADAFIANVLKSRPPGNRDPQPEEIEACRPYLERQIQLIEPRVICTLGNFATKLLSGSPAGITRVRGRPQEREVAGVPVLLFPLFHPAAALRTPAVLQQLREDFSRIPALLEQERREPEQPALAAVASTAAEPEEPPQLDLLG